MLKRTRAPFAAAAAAAKRSTKLQELINKLQTNPIQQKDMRALLNKGPTKGSSTLTRRAIGNKSPSSSPEGRKAIREMELRALQTRYPLDVAMATSLKIPTKLARSNNNIEDVGAVIRQTAVPLEEVGVGANWHSMWLEATASHLGLLAQVAAASHFVTTRGGSGAEDVTEAEPLNETNDGLLPWPRTRYGLALVHNLIHPSYFNQSIVDADAAVGGLKPEQMAKMQQLIQSVSVRQEDVAIGESIHKLCLGVIQVGAPTLVDGIKTFPNMFTPITALLSRTTVNGVFADQPPRVDGDDCEIKKNDVPALQRVLMQEDLTTYEKRSSDLNSRLSLPKPPVTNTILEEHAYFGFLGTIYHLQGMDTAARVCQYLIMTTFTNGLHRHGQDILAKQGLMEALALPQRELMEANMSAQNRRHAPWHVAVSLPTYEQKEFAFSPKRMMAREREFGTAVAIREAKNKEHEARGTASAQQREFFGRPKAVAAGDIQEF